jgi:N-acetylglucosamine kinase-like BadF-type ATPase
MAVVVGVDSGNSKTELVAATTEGELLARVRGAGANSHGVGAAAVGDTIRALVEEAGVEVPGEHGVFFLCGADQPEDVAALETAVAATGVVRSARVDNDTFALLHAGTERLDAVAVICGAGINCVARAVDGRVARYPALGWETGDWGGAEMLGREALFLAARAEDGRGEPTALVDVIRAHFGANLVEDVGIDVHYRRVDQRRLGALAPLIVDAAAGDAVASQLVDRLASEIALWVRRAFRDLALAEADVVLGGGMLQGGEDELYRRLLALLPDGATPIRLAAPPVLGAVLAALDDTGAGAAAKQRVREALRNG